MAKPAKHKWTFTTHFKKNVFGWRGSQTDINWIKEALSEIKPAARKKPSLRAEGALFF